MLRLWIRCRSWWQSDDGASLVEYALLLLLIATVAVVVITQIGANTSAAIDEANRGFK
ncbi:MAG: Flp family type IVb pilin [Acidimicrobiia bacterium]|jgi:Flp pilus assembly pilin Flp|nr:Flp family type IVb pilin [Acidimicrobiia bacterium]